MFVGHSVSSIVGALDSINKIKLVEAPTDLHVVLSQAAEIVRSDGQGKRVILRFVLEAEERHVLGDPARLQQVFWNLMKNAIKFTPAGGKVRILTRNERPGWISVRVIDSGIGIDLEGLPRIFEAFEQGTTSLRESGGLGLGLAIAHALVQMHGGSIRAESAGVGQGATFTVELATCAAPNAVDRVVPLKPGASRKLRLLLVEDQDSTREVLARILQRAGHHVATAASRAEALEIAGTAERFDVLTSDLGLPDQSGFDLMRTKARHNLPGIALSGYGMDEDVRRAREAGDDGTERKN